jgi:aerobic-type carbon monoxide dehydrogenase small subunit (CoxS/CutS family)
MKPIELRINGTKHRVETEADRSLLSVLRDDLDLTGTKYGCGEGQCGACTVLVDGQATRSCLTAVGAVAEKQITTIEGLEQNGRLHPLQEAFLAEDAMQCGYCISGMLMSGAGLLKKKPQPTDAEILHALEGNLCRCGSHPRILAAMKRATNQRSGQKGGAR